MTSQSTSLSDDDDDAPRYFKHSKFYTFQSTDFITAGLIAVHWPFMADHHIDNSKLARQ
jgi:hypothetical protein